MSLTAALSKEKLTSVERIEQAKKKRKEQIEAYKQYDQKTPTTRGSLTTLSKKKKRSSISSVAFSQNIQLMEAVSRADLAEMEMLLKAGVDPNLGNEDGVAPLHQGCIDNSQPVVNLLLKYNADVNVKDREMWTPLHVAATCGHLNIVKLLIEKGADLLAVNGDGNMPYDICEQEQTLTFIESEMFKRGITQDQIDRKRKSRENDLLEELRVAMIFNANKLPKYVGPRGESLLHVSVVYGYSRLTDILLRNRAKVKAVDNDNWQPIHCATYWGQLHLIEILLRNGADLNAKTKTGETALDLCANETVKKQVLQIREEANRKGQIKKNYFGSISNKSSGSIKRLSSREKTEMTNKDSKVEGLSLSKIFEKGERLSSTEEKNPKIDKSQKRFNAQKGRRRSSTQINLTPMNEDGEEISEDILRGSKFKEEFDKRCIIS